MLVLRGWFPVCQQEVAVSFVAGQSSVGFPGLVRLYILIASDLSGPVRLSKAVGDRSGQPDGAVRRSWMPSSPRT
jgi:hypothetical protein